jgi:hypothetical protein
VVKMDLTQILRSVSELNVNGHKEFATIQVRQNIQARYQAPPLFIIDGSDRGTNYMDIYRAINPHDVRRVQALNDAKAMSTYGSRGKNGAIIIETVKK